MQIALECLSSWDKASRRVSKSLMIRRQPGPMFGFFAELRRDQTSLRGSFEIVIPSFTKNGLQLISGIP